MHRYLQPAVDQFKAIDDDDRRQHALPSARRAMTAPKRTQHSPMTADTDRPRSVPSQGHPLDSSFKRNSVRGGYACRGAGVQVRDRQAVGYAVPVRERRGGDRQRHAEHRHRLASRARIDEKANVCGELEATGVANHVAHVHLGRYAVDALVDALGAVREFAEIVPELPAAVERTIPEAKPVSETVSDEGRPTPCGVLRSLPAVSTAASVNAIPDRARVLCAIRIPSGVAVDRAGEELAAAIDLFPDVSRRTIECTEPSWTEPEGLSGRTARTRLRSLGGGVVVNLRQSARLRGSTGMLGHTAWSTE